MQTVKLHNRTIQATPISIDWNPELSIYVSEPFLKTVADNYGWIGGEVNLLQQWVAIKIFRNLGVSRYDYVGVRIDQAEDSKQEGLMTFKQRFGGNLAKGFMWKCSLQPLKYAVYSHAVKLLRGGDIVDAEHHKLDNIEADMNKIK